MALQLIALCQNQEVLIDPTSSVAGCIHRQLLSDEVLRCQGIRTWNKGNKLLISNKQETPKVYMQRYYKDMFTCIYKRGEWTRACGTQSANVMYQLTKDFINIGDRYSGISMISMDSNIMCDICKDGSDIRVYQKLDELRHQVLVDLLYNNLNSTLYSQCSVTNYPLDQCHQHQIWERDLYSRFCFQIQNEMIPLVTPYLPICDIGQWILSASRICNMGFQRLNVTLTNMAMCTKNQDELFPCYKGVNQDLMSWGFISAGRMWSQLLNQTEIGTTHDKIYSHVKLCAQQVYSKLAGTCRYGLEVVQLIQDVRTLLRIDLAGIFSNGHDWYVSHLKLDDLGQHVNQC